jgi:amidophosphoribosyltransferase
MCGIVGLFFKGGAARPALGPLLVGMLSQMAERGPDSTGFALYLRSAGRSVQGDIACA